MLKQLLVKISTVTFVISMLMACASPHVDYDHRSGRSLPDRGLSAGMILLKASQAENRKDYATAKMYYQQFLERFPGDVYEAEALTKFGRTQENLGDYTAALTTYQRVETEHSQSLWAAEAMLNAGRLYLQLSDTPAALAQAEKVITRSSASSEQQRQGYLLRADSYMEQYTPQPALIALMQAYALTDTQLLPNLKNEIQEYIRNVDTEMLIAVEKEVPAGTAHNWLAYLIGIRLMEEDQNQAALDLLTATIITGPQSPYADDARNRVEQLNRLLTPDTTTIGCLLPLSGPYQTIGESALAGIEIALHELGNQIPNRRFSIVVADTAGNHTKVLAALEHLSQKRVAAVIGPIVTAKAVAHRANEMAIPLLTLNQSAEIPQIGPFIFRNFITPQMQVQALAEFTVMTQGIDRAAILYPDEKYGQYYADLFRSEVQALGGQISIEVPYMSGSTDFKEPIEMLSDISSDFDALFIPDADDTIGLILPQLRFYDIKDKLLLGTNLWYTDKLIEMAAPYASKAVCPADFFKESSSPQVIKFIKTMNNIYHQMPSYVSAIAYDTAAILFKASANAIPDDPYSIREALIQMAPHDGLTGKSWFEENGETSREITLVRIRNNRFEAIGKE